MPSSDRNTLNDQDAPDLSASVSLADIVFDTLDVGAALLDKNGCYIAVNKHYKSLIGVDETIDLLGQSHFSVCRAILAPHDFDRVRAGVPLREQISQVTTKIADGTDKILRWNAVPVSGDRDWGDAVCAIVLRRVERSQEEMKQLLRDRDQLRFAVHGADYGLWDWDLVTDEVFFSERYMDMLGYEQFELPHSFETWEKLCKPEDLPSTKDTIEDYLSVGDRFYEAEFQMIRKDGSLIWILSRGKIVSWQDDGSPLRIVGTHQDISALKEREEALLKAKEEADKANKTKSDFLALISHEVRTPLNAITSILQLLGDEADAAERKRLSQIALNSSDQLLTVLSDVLDVSKMEAGRFDINLRPVNIADLVEELSQTHRKAIEAKGLSFDLSVRGDANQLLMIDPVRVTQIISNFLSNATKFTSEGNITLSVDIDSGYDDLHQNSVYVSFAIKDDGLGLSPSEREKLFQPFYQVEGARSRTSEGTGLGLSICKKLASLMGGKVWCASKKGTGSTFYFEAAFSVANAAVEAVKSDERMITNCDRSVVHVLAAEDNPVNQMMLKKFIKDRLGYQLTVVGNGADVMAALKEKTYDVILMDIHMPVQDGVVTTHNIRASDQLYNNIPIIALTADATQDHIKEYIASGFDECVAKPVDWQFLDGIIQQLISSDHKSDLV